MDNCPLEILELIFSLSCTDDGTTGRSLSLVSRPIARASQTFKYQSLAVFGLGQLCGILSVFEGTESRNVRVKYLYLSDVREPGRLPVEPWGIIRSRPGERDELLHRLFALISPSLQILYMNLHYHRSYFLVPIHLHSLTHLSVRGTYDSHPDPLTDALEPFSKLTHVHLAGFRKVFAPSIIGGEGLGFHQSPQRSARLVRLVPQLTHLRVSDQCMGLFDWVTALDLPRVDADLDLSSAANPHVHPTNDHSHLSSIRLPSSVERVQMSLGPRPPRLSLPGLARLQWYAASTNALRRLALRDPLRRIIVCECDEEDDRDRMLEEWRDTVQGDDQYWVSGIGRSKDNAKGSK